MSKTSTAVSTRPTVWRAGLWGLAGGVLLAPALAMRWGFDVHWSAGDFLVMGALLLGSGLIIETMSRSRYSRKTRRLATVAVLVGVIWLWAELAVGIVTTWGS